MILAQKLHPVISLQGDLSLRHLQENDVSAAYVDGLNDPEVHRFLVGPRRERQTEASVRAFVQANFEADDAILFGIFLDGILRGTSRLHDIRDGTAWLGIAIFDRRVWGRGLARRAIEAIVTYASESLSVREVRAGIENENTGSQRAFAAAGFVPSAPSAQSSDSVVWIWRASDELSAVSRDVDREVT
jgi:RimJ/RimL family protein N-acetyltransferase